jgi:hypothetical protein
MLLIVLSFVRGSGQVGLRVDHARSLRVCRITADISSTLFVEELRNGTRLRR